MSGNPGPRSHVICFLLSRLQSSTNCWTHIFLQENGTTKKKSQEEEITTLRKIVSHFISNLSAHVPFFILSLSILTGKSSRSMPFAILLCTFTTCTRCTFQNCFAIFHTLVILEIFAMSSFPEICCRTVFYAFDVNASLFVSVGTLDICFAIDNSVFIVEFWNSSEKCT